MDIGGWLGRRKLEKLAEADPRFEVWVAERGLLCPYCLKLVAARGADAREKLFVHIEGICERFAEGAGSPEPMAAMEERRQFLGIREALKFHESWSITDKTGRWYCPFCAKPTKVTVDPENPSLDKLARLIPTHLRACFSYRSNPENFKPAEELRELISRLQQDEKLAAQIREKIEAGAEILMQVTRAAKWVCPYCLVCVEHVSLASEVLRRFTAPALIAKHLLHNCEGFRASRTTRPLPEVKARVAQLDGAGAPVPAKPEGGEDDYLSRIRKEIVEIRRDIGMNDELQQSLKKARQVVQQMLPKKVPVIPGYEIALHFKSCLDVGGDFYDFVEKPGGRLGIAVGDVSGHGLEAALVMGMTRKALNMRARGLTDPLEVLMHANSDIVPDLETGTFVTCFYGVLDPARHEVVLARAGHCFALHYAARSGEVRAVKSNGIPLGVLTGPGFDKLLTLASCHLEPGDILLQYSDGLTEAQDGRRELYGEQRFMDSVRAYGRHDADYLVNKVYAHVQQFMGEEPQHDDITLIAVRRKPA